MNYCFPTLLPIESNDKELTHRFMWKSSIGRKTTVESFLIIFLCNKEFKRGKLLCNKSLNKKGKNKYGSINYRTTLRLLTHNKPTNSKTTPQDLINPFVAKPSHIFSNS